MEPKRRLIIIVFSILVVAGLAAGAWWREGAGSELVLVPASLDFGDVRIGETITASLIATNRGSTPQRIDPIELSAPFGIGRDPIDLAPGESRVLSVSFKPTERGAAEGRIELKSGWRSLAGAALEGSGMRAPEVALEPPFLFFGEVQTGTQGRGLLTLWNRGDEPLEVTFQPSNGFEVEVSQITVEAESKANVEVTFHPLELGDHSGALAIATTDPLRENLSLALKGTGSAEAPRPDIQVSPGSLDFGQVPIGAAAKRQVSIHNAGRDTLRIVRVADGGKGFESSSVPLRVRPGGTVKLPVSFSPAETGRQFAPLVIYNNDPKADRSLVMLEGEGVVASAEALQKFAKASAALESSTGDPIQVAGLEERSLAASPEVPGLDPAAEEPLAPNGPQIAEGSEIQINGRRWEIFPEDFAGVEYDGATSNLALDGLLLPSVDYSFGQWFDFGEAGATGRFDSNGELSINLPLSYLNGMGQDFQLPLTLTTGTSYTFTRTGQVIVAEGSALSDGSATLVAVYEIQEGNLAGHVMRMQINVQLP